MPAPPSDAPWRAGGMEPVGLGAGLVAGPRDIDQSKRASARDTVIRHREVGRQPVGGLARGARIEIVE
jgi:hypothetical protein